MTIVNANNIMHEHDLKVTYKVELQSMFVKPLLLAAVAFGFLMVFILSFRLEMPLYRASRKSAVKID